MNEGNDQPQKFKDISQKFNVFRRSWVKRLACSSTLDWQACVHIFSEYDVVFN